MLREKRIKTNDVSIHLKNSLKNDQQIKSKERKKIIQAKVNN